MDYSTQANGPAPYARFLVMLAACLCGFSVAADTRASDSPSTSISSDATNAILKELRLIRSVLEKIEKQGTARGSKQRGRPSTASISAKDKQSMGAADAPVTVVEFTDYQCPYCLRFIKTSFPPLKQKYIDTGKVRWVALNLPLQFHKEARKAAQAAHCAGDQDKFWEMREVLFMNPKKLQVADLLEHARTLSLDMQAFDGCLNSERHLKEIDREAEDAKSVSLTGTPSFIVGKTTNDRITGQVVVGAQPTRVFEAAIDKVLAKQ